MLEQRGRQMLLLLFAVAFVAFPEAHAVSSICFERVSDIPAVYMQEHPAGGKALLATHDGMISLVTLPRQGSRKASALISTWLDLSTRVVVDDERGLLSFAFHPKFTKNGRFFVAYSCDSSIVKNCQGTCRFTRGGSCTSNTVVAEYWAGPNPRTAMRVNPREVRRILNFGRPNWNHNGGHIFFGKDSFLYYTSGDGGGQGDPSNNAQNGSTVFGKILRLNVDRFVGGYNFSTPGNNPFRGTGKALPWVYALGLRNPWRCDQDPVGGLIVCGDVGGSHLEEINVIRPGGNYEWGNYEGTVRTYKGPFKRPIVGQLHGPIFQYSHACEYKGVECTGNSEAAVIGGVFYRASINRCLQGKYLYSDLDGPMWLANIYGKLSTSRVTYQCARSTPLPCSSGGPGPFGNFYSWGRDRAKHVYALSGTGVYRVTTMASCGIRC